MNLRHTMDAADNTLAKMRLALDHHAIVSVTDRHGVITQVNDRFCDISGYARHELIGRTHGLLKSGRHDEALYQDLWRTIACGQIWHGVICNRRKNG
ncbi:MAG: PAS domain S-box protein, partial [Aquabacterium sp.]|nr:PAS domain S-box protein [Aquabacterium sp.]